MNGQRIRPTLGDLANYDEDAFPELNGQAPSATVTRSKPPNIISTSTATSQASIPAISIEPSKLKAKSRFALQREREAEKRAAAAAAKKGSERFELNLDGEEVDDEIPVMPQLVGQVVERESNTSIPLPPSNTGSFSSPVAGRREKNGFPTSDRRRDVVADSIEVKEVAAEEEEGELPSMMSSISRVNDDVLAGLSEREILEEQRQIRESMGLSEAVIKMLEARGNKKATPVIKKIAIRPPLVSVAAKSKPKPLEEEEEGTPEYIRRHFFPNEPTNSNLDWMRDPTASTSSLTQGTNLLTFDLNGEALSTESFDSNHPSSSSHHVSSSTSFTIPSLLSLTTSAVSSQRSTSLLVLTRILVNKRNQSLLGKKIWTTLRIDAGRSASWAIRDPNLGVSTAAISLLHVLFTDELETFLSPDSKTIEILAPGAEEPITLVSAFLSTDPYPSFTRQLSSSTLDISTHQSILSILHSILLLSANGQPPSLAVEELVASPSLLDSLSKRFISVSWPSHSPSTNAIQFFIDLAKSSRARARSLNDRKLVDSGLRFLGILPWELEVEFESLGYELVCKVLEYWEVIGRYGLATGLRTRAAPLLDSILSKFSTIYSSNKINRVEINLMIRTFNLLEIWTTAAVDPHTTEHDILWTQVEDWSNLAVEAHKMILNYALEEVELLGSIWQLLAVWLEGSKVNKGWRGEEERKWLDKEIGVDFKIGGWGDAVVKEAMMRLGGISPSDKDASLVSAALRLSNAYEEDSNPVTPALLILDPSTFNSIFISIFNHITPSRALDRLVIDLLPYVSSFPLRLSTTIQVLNLLRIEDAISVRNLLDWLLVNLSSPMNHSDLSQLHPTFELPSLLNLQNLKPFLTFSLNTTIGGKIISSLHPSFQNLQKTTSHYPFVFSLPLLSTNWSLGLLDELLRSGSSAVFENLPTGWDASELDLVKSALVLMRVTEGLQVIKKTEASVLIYDLIKVFMLEKDNTTKSTGEEVVAGETDLFRDSAVEFSMTQLVLPLLISSQPPQLFTATSNNHDNQSLETVSARVSTAPFYRLYTDLVGLYDSISMSHSLFASILLPPLSMSYPIDYRKLLWIDYAHVLSTIKTKIGGVVPDKQGERSLSSFLYPIEIDLGLLVAYGEALVSKKVTEEKNQFLFFVALHHLSSNLLSESSTMDLVQRNKLMRAIVGQGGKELVEKLVDFEQVEKEGERLLWIPECFVKSGEGRNKRENKVKELLDL